MTAITAVGDHTEVRRAPARPLLFELTVIVLVVLGYRMGRLVSRGALATAMDNATVVLAIERALLLDVEQGLQRLALDHHWLVTTANNYYAWVHFPSAIAFGTWLMLRHRERFAAVRTWFLSVTVAALVIHVAFPLAPPRMIDGFVDTLTTFGPRIYSSEVTGSLANQLAAMPSLHVGWSLMIAWTVATVGRGRWRRLAFVHPAATLLVVVVTGNHFVLDGIVAGALVVGLSPLAFRSVPPRPMGDVHRTAAPSVPASAPAPTPVRPVHAPVSATAARPCPVRRAAAAVARRAEPAGRVATTSEHLATTPPVTGRSTG